MILAMAWKPPPFFFLFFGPPNQFYLKTLYNFNDFAVPWEPWGAMGSFYGIVRKAIWAYKNSGLETIMRLRAARFFTTRFSKMMKNLRFIRFFGFMGRPFWHRFSMFFCKSQKFDSGPHQKHSKINRFYKLFSLGPGRWSRDRRHPSDVSFLIIFLKKWKIIRFNKVFWPLDLNDFACFFRSAPQRWKNTFLYQK